MTKEIPVCRTLIHQSEVTVTRQIQDTRRIRPIALCVVRRAGKLVVWEGYDTVKGDFYHRPLGGGVKFGERSITAAAREIVEELGEEVCNIRWLDVLESIFTVDGRPGHEIVMLFEADFVNEAMYRRNPIWGSEEDGSPIKAVWKPIDDFNAGRVRLVPEGLLELLHGGPASIGPAPDTAHEALRHSPKE